MPFKGPWWVRIPAWFFFIYARLVALHGRPLRNYLKRVVALITAITFIASSLPVDARTDADLTRVGSVSTGGHAPSGVFDPAAFALPEHLGRVRDAWSPAELQASGSSGRGALSRSGSRTVIHIQDAHCNDDCQRQIGEIIAYLVKEYRIETINLEGGVGGYDLAPFTGIADRAVREKVADHFVQKGVVSGAERFAAMHPDRVTLWGAEDAALYLKNLAVYRETLADKASIDAALGSLDRAVTAFKPAVYSKELLELDDRYGRYKKGALEFKEYLTYLTGAAAARGIALAAYANIALLVAALAEEATVDFKETTAERDRLIGRLEKVLSRAELAELLQRTAALKAGELTPGGFYSYLIKKARSAAIDPAEMPALGKYIAYISTYESIDKMKLMDEIALLEDAVKARLFENDTQRELDLLSKNLVLLENFFAIALTKSDYRYYKAHTDTFKTDRYRAFVEREGPRYKVAALLNGDLAGLDGYRERMERFFAYSFERDEAFLRNLTYTGSRQGATAARPAVTILVTGGFHAENLWELFRANKVAYVSVMPKFTNGEGYDCPYKRLLAGAPSPEDRKALAAVGVATIAVASILNQLGAQANGKETMIAFHLDYQMTLARIEGADGIRLIHGLSARFFDRDWHEIAPDAAAGKRFKDVSLPALAGLVLTGSSTPVGVAPQGETAVSRPSTPIVSGEAPTGRFSAVHAYFAKIGASLAALARTAGSARETASPNDDRIMSRRSALGVMAFGILASRAALGEGRAAPKGVVLPEDATRLIATKNLAPFDASWLENGEVALTTLDPVAVSSFLAAFEWSGAGKNYCAWAQTINDTCAKSGFFPAGIQPITPLMFLALEYAETGTVGKYVSDANAVGPLQIRISQAKQMNRKIEDFKRTEKQSQLDRLKLNVLRELGLVDPNKEIQTVTQNVKVKGRFGRTKWVKKKVVVYPEHIDLKAIDPRSGVDPKTKKPYYDANYSRRVAVAHIALDWIDWAHFLRRRTDAALEVAKGDAAAQKTIADALYREAGLRRFMIAAAHNASLERVENAYDERGLTGWSAEFSRSDTDQETIRLVQRFLIIERIVRETTTLAEMFLPAEMRANLDEIQRRIAERAAAGRTPSPEIPPVQTTPPSSETTAPQAPAITPESGESGIARPVAVAVILGLVAAGAVTMMRRRTREGARPTAEEAPAVERTAPPAAERPEEAMTLTLHQITFRVGADVRALFGLADDPADPATRTFLAVALGFFARDGMETLRDKTITLAGVPKEFATIVRYCDNNDLANGFVVRALLMSLFAASQVMANLPPEAAAALWGDILDKLVGALIRHLPPAMATDVTNKFTLFIMAHLQELIGQMDTVGDPTGTLQAEYNAWQRYLVDLHRHFAIELPPEDRPRSPRRTDLGRGVLTFIKRPILAILARFGITMSDDTYAIFVAPVVEELLFTALPLAIAPHAFGLFVGIRVAFIVLHLFGARAPTAADAKPRSIVMRAIERLAIPTVISGLVCMVVLPFMATPAFTATATLTAVTVFIATLAATSQHAGMNAVTPLINDALSKLFGRPVDLMPGDLGKPNEDIAPPDDDAWREHLTASSARFGGGAIGRFLNENGEIVKTGLRFEFAAPPSLPAGVTVSGKIVDAEGSIVLDKNGKPVDGLSVYTAIDKGTIAASIAVIKDRLADGQTLSLLQPDGAELVRAIIKHLEERSAAGSVLCLNANTNGVLGFADSEHILIHSELAINPIALFHEAAESYFAAHPEAVAQLGMSAHEYLRGAGQKERAAGPYKEGLQDLLFGSEANENLTSKIHALQQSMMQLGGGAVLAPWSYISSGLKGFDYGGSSLDLVAFQAHLQVVDEAALQKGFVISLPTPVQADYEAVKKAMLGTLIKSDAIKIYDPQAIGALTASLMIKQPWWRRYLVNPLLQLRDRLLVPLFRFAARHNLKSLAVATAAAFERQAIMRAFTHKESPAVPLLDELAALYGTRLAEEFGALIPEAKDAALFGFAASPLITRGGLMTYMQKIEKVYDYLRSRPDGAELVTRLAQGASPFSIRSAGDLGDFVENPAFREREEVDSIVLAPDAALISSAGVGSPVGGRGRFLTVGFASEKEKDVRLLKERIAHHTALIDKNFAALGILLEHTADIDEQMLDRVIDIVDGMVADYCALTAGLNQEGFRVDALLERWNGTGDRPGLKAEARSCDLRSEEGRKRIYRLKTVREPPDIETLHGFINYLHQASFAPLFELARRQNATITAHAYGKRVDIVDIGSLPVFDKGEVRSPLLASILGGIDEGEASSISSAFVMNDDLLIGHLRLGVHQADIQARLAPPDEGGMILIRYQEWGEGSGNRARLTYLTSVMHALGFDVQETRGRYLEIRLDKDHRARTIEEIRRLLPLAIKALYYTRDLDLHLKNDDAARVAADVFLEQGTIKVTHAHGLAAAALPDAAWPKLNERLAALGLDPIPSGERLTQSTIDRYVNEPIDTALDRGELIWTAPRMLAKNPRYHPIDTMLSALDERTAPEYARQAELILPAAHLLSFAPIGTVGRYLVEVGVLRMPANGRFTITILRNPDTNHIAFAAVANRTTPDSLLAFTDVETLMITAGFGRRTIEEIPPADVARDRRLLYERWSESPAVGVTVLRGIPSSPGLTGTKVAGGATLDKEHPAAPGERKILIASHTGPSDVPALGTFAGIITSGGGVLAHAAITARELGIPAIILPGAELVERRAGDGVRKVWEVPVYEPVAAERTASGFLLSRRLTKTVVEIGEETPLVIDGIEGTVTVETQPGALANVPIASRETAPVAIVPGTVRVPRPATLPLIPSPAARGFIAPLDKITGADAALTGPKAANLGELKQFLKGLARKLSFTVPDGFVITAAGFDHFVDTAGIRPAIDEVLAMDIPDVEKQARIRELFTGAFTRYNGSLGRDIASRARSLIRRGGWWAVRSSNVAEDSADAAFAGLGDTALFIGNESLFKKVVENFASFATARALSYRAQRGLDLSEMSHAVIVQEMVDADISGVIFTADPVTGNTATAVINASYGLGEAVVSGLVQPDQYVVDKATGGEEREAFRGTKRVQVVKRAEGEGTAVVSTPLGRRMERALSRDWTKRLAMVAAAIEAHYGYPVDIEFAIKGQDLYILQVRPITTKKAAYDDAAIRARQSQFAAWGAALTGALIGFGALAFVAPLAASFGAMLMAAYFPLRIQADKARTIAGTGVAARPDETLAELMAKFGPVIGPLAWIHEAMHRVTKRIGIREGSRFDEAIAYSVEAVVAVPVVIGIAATALTRQALFRQAIAEPIRGPPAFDVTFTKDEVFDKHGIQRLSKAIDELGLAWPAPPVNSEEARASIERATRLMLNSINREVRLINLPGGRQVMSNSDEFFDFELAQTRAYPLRAVVSELVDNAYDACVRRMFGKSYTEGIPNIDTARVRVSTEIKDGYLEIAIRDNGGGIKGAYPSGRIDFNDFGMTNSIENMMMGGAHLAMDYTQAIVGYYGGAIEWRPSPDDQFGTEVVIRLPLEGSPSIAKRPPAPRPPAAAQQFAGTMIDKSAIPPSTFRFYAGYASWQSAVQLMAPSVEMVVIDLDGIVDAATGAASPDLVRRIEEILATGVRVGVMTASRWEGGGREGYDTLERRFWGKIDPKLRAKLLIFSDMKMRWSFRADGSPILLGGGYDIAEETKTRTRDAVISYLGSLGVPASAIRVDLGEASRIVVELDDPDHRIRDGLPGTLPELLSRPTLQLAPSLHVAGMLGNDRIAEITMGSRQRELEKMARDVFGRTGRSFNDCNILAIGSSIYPGGNADGLVASAMSLGIYTGHVAVSEQRSNVYRAEAEEVLAELSNLRRGAQAREEALATPSVAAAVTTPSVSSILSGAFISNERTGQHIFTELGKMDMDWTVHDPRMRWRLLNELVREERHLSKVDQRVYRKSGMTFIKIDGLFHATGQFAHLAFGQTYGHPVAYIDKDVAETYDITDLAVIEGHEREELKLWRAALGDTHSPFYGKVTTLAGIRAWMRAFPDEAAAFATYLHELTNKADGGRYNVDRLAAKHGVRPYVYDAGELAPGETISVGSRSIRENEQIADIAEPLAAAFTAMGRLSAADPSLQDDIEHLLGGYEGSLMVPRLLLLSAARIASVEPTFSEPYLAVVRTELDHIGAPADIRDRTVAMLRTLGLNSPRANWFYSRLVRRLGLYDIRQERGRRVYHDRVTLTSEQTHLLNAITPVYSFDKDGTLDIRATSLKPSTAARLARLIATGAKVGINTARAMYELGLETDPDTKQPIEFYAPLREAVIALMREEGWGTRSADAADDLLTDLYELIFDTAATRAVPRRGATKQEELVPDPLYQAAFSAETAAAVEKALAGPAMDPRLRKLIDEEKARLVAAGYPYYATAACEPVMHIFSMRLPSGKTVVTKLLYRPFGEVSFKEGSPEYRVNKEARDKITRLLDTIFDEMGIGRHPREGQYGILPVVAGVRAIDLNMLLPGGQRIQKDRAMRWQHRWGYREVNYFDNESLAGNGYAVTEFRQHLEREPLKDFDLTVYAVDPEAPEGKDISAFKGVVHLGRGMDGTATFLDSRIAEDEKRKAAAVAASTMVNAFVMTDMVTYLSLLHALKARVVAIHRALNERYTAYIAGRVLAVDAIPSYFTNALRALSETDRAINRRSKLVHAIVVEPGKAATPPPAALRAGAIISNEATGDHIFGELALMGMDWSADAPTARWDKLQALLTSQQALADPEKTVYEKDGLVFIKIPGLLSETGQFGHIGLGQTYGHPVVYIDKDVADTFASQDLAVVEGHERYEIALWQKALADPSAPLYGKVASLADVRAWMRENVADAFALAERLHTETNKAENGAYDVDALAERLGIAPYSHDVAELTEGETPATSAARARGGRISLRTYLRQISKRSVVMPDTRVSFKEMIDAAVPAEQVGTPTSGFGYGVGGEYLRPGEYVIAHAAPIKGPNGAEEGSVLIAYFPDLRRIEIRVHDGRMREPYYPYEEETRGEKDWGKALIAISLAKDFTIEKIEQKTNRTPMTISPGGIAIRLTDAGIARQLPALYSALAAALALPQVNREEREREIQDERVIPLRELITRVKGDPAQATAADIKALEACRNYRSPRIRSYALAALKALVGTGKLTPARYEALERRFRAADIDDEIAMIQRAAAQDPRGVVKAVERAHGVLINADDIARLDVAWFDRGGLKSIYRIDVVMRNGKRYPIACAVMIANPDDRDARLEQMKRIVNYWSRLDAADLAGTIPGFGAAVLQLDARPRIADTVVDYDYHDYDDERRSNWIKTDAQIVFREFVEGQPLDEVLRSRTITDEEKRAAIRAALDAYCTFWNETKRAVGKHLHIGDPKPQNVVVAKDPKSGKYRGKLIDLDAMEQCEEIARFADTFKSYPVYRAAGFEIVERRGRAVVSAATPPPAALRAGAIISNEATGDHIFSELALMGMDWSADAPTARWDKLQALLTSQQALADPAKTVYAKDGLVFIKITGLLTATGQFGHIGLGQTYGHPVVYIDKDVADTFASQDLAVVEGHERYEIALWQKALTDPRAPLFNKVASLADVRAWMRENLADAFALAERLHTETNTADNGAYDVDALAKRLGIAPYSHDVAELTEGETPAAPARPERVSRMTPELLAQFIRNPATTPRQIARYLLTAGIRPAQVQLAREVIAAHRPEAAAEFEREFVAAYEAIERLGIAVRSMRHGEAIDITATLTPALADLWLLVWTDDKVLSSSVADLMADTTPDEHIALEEHLRRRLQDLLDTASEASRSQTLMLDHRDRYLAELRDILGLIVALESGLQTIKQAYRLRQPADGETAETFDRSLRNFAKTRRILESRIELVTAQPVRSVEPIGEIIAEAVAAGAWPRESVEIVTDADANGLTVEANRTALLSALYNVINNAVHFAEKKNGRYRAHVTVRIGTATDPATGGRRAVVTVSDNGAGIAPALLEMDPVTGDRPLLFTINASQREGGTGLGATEAWYVVRDLGGRIDVASQNDVGATFTIRLPLAGSAAATPAIGARVGQPGAPSPAMPPRGIDRLYVLYQDFLDAKRVPRTAAIADIHGNDVRLTELLAEIGPTAEEIVFLGDYMDRGPASIEVYEKIRDLTAAGKAVPLMGNHDLLFIAGMLGSDVMLEKWVMPANGGAAVLLELETYQKGKFALTDWKSATIRQNPKLREIAAWMMQNLKLYYIGKDGGLYMHAGMPLDAQGRVTLAYGGYRGMEALAKLEEEMEDAFAAGNGAAPAIDLLNSGDDTSPLWVRNAANGQTLFSVMAAAGSRRILDQLGTAFLVTGHVARSQIAVVDNVIFGIDRQMVRGEGAVLWNDGRGLLYDSVGLRHDRMVAPLVDFERAVTAGRARAEQALANRTPGGHPTPVAQRIVGPAVVKNVKTIAFPGAGGKVLMALAGEIWLEAGSRYYRFTPAAAGRVVVDIFSQSDLLHPVRSASFEEGTTFTIGRNTDNGLVVEDALLSRRHLEIRVDTPAGKRVMAVTDPGSANGTFQIEVTFPVVLTAAEWRAGKRPEGYRPVTAKMTAAFERLRQAGASDPGTRYADELVRDGFPVDRWEALMNKAKGIGSDGAIGEGGLTASEAAEMAALSVDFNAALDRVIARYGQPAAPVAQVSDVMPFGPGLAGVPDGVTKRLLEAMAKVDQKHGPGSVVLYGGAVRDLLLGVPKTDGDLDILIRIDRLPNGEYDQAKAHAIINDLESALGLARDTIYNHDTNPQIGDAFVEMAGLYDGATGTIMPKQEIEQFIDQIQESIETLRMTSDGIVVDPYGGRVDLASGTIRFVGANVEGNLNHQTVLRAVRMKHQFGFSYDSATGAVIASFFKDLDRHPQGKFWLKWLRDVAWYAEYRQAVGRQDWAEALRLADDFIAAIGPEDRAFLRRYDPRDKYSGFDISESSALELMDENRLVGNEKDAVDYFEEFVFAHQRVRLNNDKWPFGRHVTVDLAETKGTLHARQNDPFGLGISVRDIINHARDPRAAVAELKAIGFDRFATASGIDLDEILARKLASSAGPRFIGKLIDASGAMVTDMAGITVASGETTVSIRQGEAVLKQIDRAQDIVLSDAERQALADLLGRIDFNGTPAAVKELFARLAAIGGVVSLEHDADIKGIFYGDTVYLDKAFVANLKEFLALAGQVKAGPVSIKDLKAVDPVAVSKLFGLIHELGEGFVAMPGGTYGAMTRHTRMRGVGKDVRNAFFALGERAATMAADELIAALEAKMREPGFVMSADRAALLRKPGGNALTESERALIKYNATEAQGTRTGKRLLYGIQDDIDPDGNMRFTQEVKAITSTLRQNVMNIFMVPESGDAAIVSAGQQTAAAQAAKRLYEKKYGQTTVVQHYNGATFGEQLAKAIATAEANPTLYPRIGIYCLTDADLAAARDFQRDPARYAALFAGMTLARPLAEYAEGITILNDTVGDKRTIADEVKVIAVGAALMNDRRLKEDFRMGSLELVQYRKDLVQFLRNNQMIDIDDAVVADPALLDAFFSDLWKGIKSIQITRVNWESFRDWKSSYDQVLRSL